MRTGKLAGLATNLGQSSSFCNRKTALAYLASLGVVLILCSASVRAESYTWKSVAIHGGGFVAGIIPHPSVPGLIYARTDVGGAYRWDSIAKSWVALTDWVSQADGNLMGCESIAVDPSAPNRLYLALGTYTNSWGKNGAIVRSNDRGQTFARTDVPFKMGGNDPGRSAGERLTVDPNDGRIIFFGSRADGLWKSADRAKSWARVSGFPAVATSPSAVDAKDPQWALGISFVKCDGSTAKHGEPTPVIYAGVCTQETSFFRSSDGGSTWSAVPGQPVGLRPNHMVISSNDLCYISYGDQEGPNEMADGAIWRFNPKTGKWTDLSPAKPAVGDTFGYGAITVDARHPDTLMACSLDRWAHGDSIFRTTDGGMKWTEQIVGGDHRDRALLDASNAPWAGSLAPHWLGDVELDPFDSNHALFVTGFGIWVTHDATVADSGKPMHWAFEDRGLEETVPLELISPHTGAHLISAIADFDGFTHQDLDVPPANGRHQPSVGSTSGLDFAGLRPKVVVRAGGNGKGFYSNDGGQSWTAFSAKPRGANSGGAIAVSSNAETILWQPGRGAVSRTTDRGNIWTTCKGLPGPLHPVADRVDPEIFYAFSPESGHLFVSRDGGENFASSSQTLPGGKASLRAVPGHLGDLWLVAGGQLYRSSKLDHPFEKIDTVAGAGLVGFGKAPPGNDYPAVYIEGTVKQVTGVFRSDDVGVSWVRIDDDKHRYGSLEVLIGDPRVYGRVYVGTGGRGVVYGDRSF